MYNVSDYEIREVKGFEIPTALELVRRVFLEYEAPDYEPEGIAEFFRTIENQEFLEKLRMYGAWKGDQFVGVLATRSEGRHIALFFVDSSYQQKGIGRLLFETAYQNAPLGEMTVNSSPYAVGVYRKFGFADTGAEEIVNGIRFTPMKIIKDR
jgi:GNAT superfamily N-acetyltransferase